MIVLWSSGTITAYSSLTSVQAAAPPDFPACLAWMTASKSPRTNELPKPRWSKCGCPKDARPLAKAGVKSESDLIQKEGMLDLLLLSAPTQGKSGAGNQQ